MTREEFIWAAALEAVRKALEQNTNVSLMVSTSVDPAALTINVEVSTYVTGKGC